MLLLAGAAGLGLAVRHWRAASPALVDRLERLEHTPPSNQDTGRHAEVETEPPSEARPTGAERPPPSSSRLPKLRADAEPLDLNRATLVDLTRLPGVGPVLARRILDTRDAAGRFATVDDLAAVRGLGRARLERLRPLVGVLD